MPVIDASAYPHIVKAILTEPVAWCAARSLNREWRDTIDAALSVVTMDCTVDECGCSASCKAATAISLTTAPTPHLAPLTLDIDAAVAKHLGRLPPIGRLQVNWPGDHCAAFFFELFGKVDTIRLLEACNEWTLPCTTLISAEQVLDKVPACLRKLVIVNDGSERILWFSTFEDIPDSVSEITLPFPPWQQWRHSASADFIINVKFCRPLATPLTSGRAINLVQMHGDDDEIEHAWFASRVRDRVGAHLYDPTGPYTDEQVEHINEVMTRFKIFHIDTYRQLYPNEI